MQVWDESKQAELENAWLNYRQWAVTSRAFRASQRAKW
jgi:hypothetical protein